MEKAEQRGLQSKFIETVKDRVAHYRASRDIIPTYDFGSIVGDSYVEGTLDSLSEKAQDVCQRRRYGARVNRAFDRYNLNSRLNFLLPEEVALLKTNLHLDYVQDQQELDLVAKAKPFSPIPQAHAEIIVFDEIKKGEFEYLIRQEIAKGAPPGVLEIGLPEVYQSLYRLARGVKIADTRAQELAIKKDFVERTIIKEQSKIIEVHQMLRV